MSYQTIDLVETGEVIESEWGNKVKNNLDFLQEEKINGLDSEDISKTTFSNKMTVSTLFPESGDGEDGDFWFVIE